MNFITGGTGFLGAHLLYKLTSEGFRVKALKRKGSNISLCKRIFESYTDTYHELMGQIDWVEGDLMDIYSLQEALEGCSYIHHCAAYVSFDKSDRDKMQCINVEGTRNLVNVALECRSLKKFCHVSSIASLGKPKEGQLFIEETDNWEDSKKLSIYSKTKYQAELEVWRGIEEGLNAVVVLPSVIVGSGNWNEGSAKLLKLGFEGQNFYSTGTNGFVDVRDVVDIMTHLTFKTSIINEKFILNGENVSYKDFFSHCAIAANKKVPNIKLSKKLTNLARVLDFLMSKVLLKKPTLTKSTVRIAFGTSSYSTKKITEQLGIKFVSMEESVKYWVKIYLKEKNNGLL